MSKTLTNNEKVREFYRAFKQDAFIPAPGKVGLGEDVIAPERLALKLDLIAEEFAELSGAVLGARARAHMEEAWAHARTLDDGERDVVEAADATADLRYVIEGFDIETGIPSDEIFTEVHDSNMSKLDAKGQPIISDGSTGKPVGKILKSAFFFAPNIANIIKVARLATVAVIAPRNGWETKGSW